MSDRASDLVRTAIALSQHALPRYWACMSERKLATRLLSICIKVSVNENFSTLLDFVFFGFLA